MLPKHMFADLATGKLNRVVKNKSSVLIDKIEEVGNYAIRIIFSDDHSSGIFSWDLLYDFGKNEINYMEKYYNSLKLV